MGRVAVFALLAVVLGAGCTSGSSTTSDGPDRSPATAALPAWLLGLWSREWIQRQGVQTNTFTVRYLQTPSLFGDVRLPIDRPAWPHATSFTDLTDDQLAVLAKQRGFIGRTSVANLISTWHHEVDFQPPDPEADTGRIERVGNGRMQEHGLDGSFTELWWSVTSGDDRFLAIRVERAGRLDRTLLVAGDYFYYGRNRAKDLPPAASLDALIAATKATRSEVIAYLDCELSVGRIRGGSTPWEIQYSTLPWREGRRLDFVDRVRAGGSIGGLAPVVEAGESWTVPVSTLSAEDLAALFPASG